LFCLVWRPVSGVWFGQVLAMLAVLRLLQLMRLMQLMQLIDDDRFMHSPESTSGYWIRPTLYPTLPYPTLPSPALPTLRRCWQ
jgi:hypothetical protein